MYIIIIKYYNDNLIYIIIIKYYNIFIYKLFEIKYICLHTIFLIDIINNKLQAKLKLIIINFIYFLLFIIL